jgi:hypothetical protein
VASEPWQIVHFERKALNPDTETKFIEKKLNFEIMNLETSFNRSKNEFPLLDFICSTCFQ